MSEIIRAIEQIGIDILLTGVFVLTTFFLAWSIARARTVPDGVRTASRRLYSILTVAFSVAAGIRRPPQESKDEANHSRMIIAGMCVGVLALAVMTGRMFILLGDEVLDSDFIANRVFLYVPSFDSKWDDKRKWDEEDKLKRKTLDDAADWSRVDRRTCDLLKPYVDQCGENKAGSKDEASLRCGNSRNDCAKAFFQLAQAIIRERGSAETRAMLSRETSIAEFLSVVFAAVWVLFFAGLFGPMRRSLMQLLVGPRGRRLPKKLAKNLVFLAWLWIAEGIALRLWTEQTTLLDRKVIYSYLTIASEENPATGVQPGPSEPTVAHAMPADSPGS